MIRDIQAMLAYECKRRPELAAFAERVDLSDEEIDNYPVAMPWMRKALHDLKQKRSYSRMEASADDWVVDGRSTDPIGLVRRWTGADTFVQVGRTQLLVTTGSLFWLDRSGIWFDTIFTTVVDPAIKANSVPAGEATRSQYIEMLRSRHESVEVVEPVAPASRFTIFRPA